MGQLLEFEVAFPYEQPLSPEEYLKGGSRSVILNVAAFFLGFKSYNSKYNDKRELLGDIFGPENNGFANEVYDKIKAIEKTGASIGIINTYSSLKLFEYFFAKGEDAETQIHAEFERNLFKAYLVLNSEFTKAQGVAFSSTKELDDELKIPMMMFCMYYPVSDKMNFDISQIWVTQMIKAIYLFQFLEAHAKTKTLLAAFLAYFNSPTWQNYLKSLLPLTMPAIQNEREAHTDISVTPGEKFEEGCAFIEKLIVQDNDELDENDFLTIRARPFYKIKDGVYRIIFNLFVVEKIFKGVYFLLRDVNNKLPKEHKFKELKSFYGDEFSEKVLFYKVVESIYPTKCIRFSGKELTDMKIDGAPDYYIRKGKNILLFESKDFLIRADKKASFNFNVYEEEFQRVLYYQEMPDGTEKHKAVIQLINSIHRLLKNEFKADTDYYYKDVFIHPILITHDHQYDTPGFNNLINYWFQNELEVLKEEGLFIHHVKPLTVVNIDSLIFHQVGLSENIPLNEVLNAYYEHIWLKPGVKFKTVEEYKTYRMSKLIPFSLFIDKYFNEKGIKKLPPMLEIVRPALFKEELEKRCK
jgi:hypothetical protein